MINRFKTFKPEIDRPRPAAVVESLAKGENMGRMVKLIPLGGVGDVTKNMYIYETDRDLIVIDCGVGFPDEGMLGIDLVIPDISYLKDKKQKLRAIIISHGHEDHIGSLPFLWPEMEAPIYAQKLAAGFIRSKFSEHKLPKDKIITLDPSSKLEFGDFKLSFYRVSHSVPDAVGIIIDTPVGKIIHQSDFKLDWTPVNNQLPDLATLAQAGNEGVLLMLIDALRSERKGVSPSEKPIQKAISEIEIAATGKMVVTINSSNITRMQQIINVASESGRKVAIVGRSVENNFQVARDLGYLEVPPGVMIAPDAIKTTPDQKLMVIISGSQGQPGSSLSRAANNDHRFLRLKKGDSVVFSADPIPLSANEYYAVVDKLIRMGMDVYYSDITEDLHTSGHGSADEIKIMLRTGKPKYVMPIGATFRGVKAFEKLSKELGYSESQIMALYEQRFLILTPGKVEAGDKFDTQNVYVDGLGVGDVGNVVLRDRQVMAEEGIVLVVVPIDAQSGKLAGEADIISRGVVFEKESEGLLSEARQVVQAALSDHQGETLEWRFTRRHIEEALERFFYDRMHRRPLILPVVVEV